MNAKSKNSYKLIPVTQIHGYLTFAIVFSYNYAVMSIKKILLSSILSVYIIGFAHAQNTILTAAEFFDSVSSHIGSIETYEADLEMKITGNSAMNARISFKQPNLLRLDFSEPATQVIVFNGNLLTVYLPGSRVILSQSVQGSDATTEGMNLATPDGLALMRRYYSISYEVGQSPVALDPDAVGTQSAEEQVIKLLLSRRNTSEGFRTIKLAINPDTLLIRRIEALSVDGKTFTLDFFNYVLDQNIPTTRFFYDTPSSANTINDFLFTESD